MLGIKMEDVMIMEGGEACLNQVEDVQSKIKIKYVEETIERETKDVQGNIGNSENTENSVIETKQIDGKFHCEICEYSTSRKSNIKLHKTVHDKNIGLTYKCEECNFKTKSKSHLKSHMLAKHEGLRFDCDFCRYQTAYKKSLNRHRETKHNNGETPFQCERCDFSSGYIKRDLKIHMSKAHNGCKYIQDVKKEDELKEELKSNNS